MIKAFCKNEKYNFIRLAEQTNDSVTIELYIPRESVYFDGHFPQVKILPAVAQIELVSLFAKEYFNSNINIKEIKRVKFTDFITPSIPLVLRISKNGNSISFKINSTDGENTYSFGTLIINE